MCILCCTTMHVSEGGAFPNVYLHIIYYYYFNCIPCYDGSLYLCIYLHIFHCAQY